MLICICILDVCIFIIRTGYCTGKILAILVDYSLVVGLFYIQNSI